MQSIFPQIPSKLIETIKKATHIAIIAHKNPDGDALSSSLALRDIMLSLNKNVVVLNDGPFNIHQLDFPSKDIQTTVPEGFKENNPLVIIVDCSTPDRPGKIYKELESCTTIVIDHHSAGELFTQKELSYIVPESPSTTLLIDELREALDLPLSYDIAKYLYIGLATDTGFFHFLNEKQGAYAFYKASIFSGQGINPYDIYDTLNDGKSLSELKLAASIIEKAKLYNDGQLVIAEQPKGEDIKVSDSVYHQILTVDGVKAIVFIKYKEDHIELGFRAKRKAGIDVGAIAASLGGGGHKLAAGASIKIEEEAIENFILDLFKAYF